MTIIELRNKLKNKQVSSFEITQEYLQKIKKEDKKIHSFLDIYEKDALEMAKRADKILKENPHPHPLCGIPCAIKDNILIEGHITTAGSKILENYISPYDATVIKKLKDAGVVFLGKTNLDEFAMGSSTENSAFGPTRNPNDLNRVAGGSSGGSAAAVKSDFCVFALGSDTGGSIREPASFCGVVGLKPTYGSVSRYGLIAMASSLDVIGPITKTVEDAKIVFEAIRGRDPMDSTSFDFIPSEKQIKKIKDLKIAILKEGISDDVDPLLKESILRLKKDFKNDVSKIEIVSLPSINYALPTYYIIMASEVSTNLARFDGIRYGKSADPKEYLNVDEFYIKTRSRFFGPEVKRRIMLGTYSLSAGYYDEFYSKACRVQGKIISDFKKLFSKFDLLILPTSPYPAFKLGEKIDDPVQMYLSDIFTVPINLAQLPAISIPFAKKENLPLGLQIVGPKYSEDKIFNFSKFIMNSKQLLEFGI